VIGHCPRCGGTENENSPFGRSCHVPTIHVPNKRCNDCGHQWGSS
jgi:hypothetical protein